MISANDQLRDYCCTDNYYRFTSGLLLTDGTKALADKFGCYWFLDIVASYQPRLKDEEFQVWTLTKNEDESAVVVCTDGNDHVLRTQKVFRTDFSADIATVWIEGDIILLPSEH